MSTTFQGGCHCGSVRYTFSIDNEKLPLGAGYCHCDDCRLTIGGFCGLYAPVPAHTFALTETFDGALVRYKASPRLTRTHCSKCGTSLTADDGKGLVVALVMSTIETPPGLTYDNIVKPTYHIFLKDTAKGGIATIMDDGLPRYKGWKEDGLWTDGSKPAAEETQPARDGEITGGCHCKGIQFTVKRAPENWAEDPVLMKWIKRGNRFSAIHCFCDTCRRVSGAPFWTWAFVPHKLITFTSNSTERVYRSSASKPCERRFCGTCGCTFSYTASPGFEMWDMSVATFDPFKLDGWLSFRPAPPGEDPVDEALGGYIHGWLDSPERRPISYAVDGEKYNPTLLEQVKRGKARSERF
ncbi:hypothetical protein EXIGLDRAFT_839748 [Exidia glandulosa HHB12029]|uniref:CENP-V/GFA domain-containing protein n=1 Tax=Exidia glandulosa HHB12029 TaxID=1314781 RepID=A0A165EUE6_EXIGL|nr:hypothetical protein EXIGLDRAFT_839748 [Exidia glandulosa HHB12029]